MTTISLWWLISPLDRIEAVGDWIVVSESVVAVTQGRAVPESAIRIGLLAKVLWRFVRKVPYGTGLRRPSSMQCAINECGAVRILCAAVIGGITRLFGRRGDFYRIAGKQAATIDAAQTSPLQPECVIMGAGKPGRGCRKDTRHNRLRLCDNGHKRYRRVVGNWIYSGY